MKETYIAGSSLYHDDFDGDYYSQTRLDRETLIEEGDMPRCGEGKKVGKECISKGCCDLTICRATNGFDEDVPPEERAKTYPPSVARGASSPGENDVSCKNGCPYSD